MSPTEHAFVFADLAGYTALTEAHGDESAADLATRFHSLAGACLSPPTRVVKTIGDAVMVVGPTIESAIVAALALASAVDALPTFPAVRIGIHAGWRAEVEGRAVVNDNRVRLCGSQLHTAHGIDVSERARGPAWLEAKERAWDRDVLQTIRAERRGGGQVLGLRDRRDDVGAGDLPRPRECSDARRHVDRCSEEVRTSLDCRSRSRVPGRAGAPPSFGWLTWRRDHRFACRDWCTAGANCPRCPGSRARLTVLLSSA